MEWVDRLNESIAYIEEHLSEEIDYAQLGRIACCSAYHYQRLFTYMAGVPLAEYIRRRRMSLAAAELQSGGSKIIDLAAKYGYSSPTAFNRAFQSVHGVAPSVVKNQGVPLKTYSPLHFHIAVTGADQFNYRLESKPAFRVLGLATPMASNLEQNFAEVPQLWQKLAVGDTMPRLLSLMQGEPTGLLGVSACGDDEQWQYIIGVASNQPAAEWNEYQVGSFTWAIFFGAGACPQAIQQLERRIITEWLPESGYEYDNGPDIEVYLSPNPADAKFEVWLPVKFVGKK